MSKFKGQIKGFPKQVVKKILEHQVAQGNERDVSVFENDCHAWSDTGGFKWDDSPEDFNFWDSVITKKNFDKFFEKYPKKRKAKFQGEIKGFPKQVVAKMLEHQVAQGNERDVSVFENYCSAWSDTGGFKWDDSPEDFDFWYSVITRKDFDLFFEEYPKKKKTKAKDYPKIMIIADNEEELEVCGCKRVVFMEKNGKYLAWNSAETLEEAENETNVCAWKFAKDIPRKTVITKQEIADKFGVEADDLEIEL